MTSEKLMDFGRALGIAYRSAPVAALPAGDPRRDALLAAWLRFMCSATSELILDGWIAQPGRRAEIKAAIAELRHAIGRRLAFVLTALRRAGQHRAAFAAPILLGNFAAFELLYKARWSMPIRKLLAAPHDSLAKRQARKTALSGQGWSNRVGGPDA